ncbi:MAG TPA: AAA family ATPase [Dictyobacter sp.]|jgi:KaiC/GvpD/RAD55 family RecA-like ATPase|nr:AAA family ATPase [Dictyobacter sp.]
MRFTRNHNASTSPTTMTMSPFSQSTYAQHTGISTEHKKRVPNSEDLLFLQVLHAIERKDITTREEIALYISDKKFSTIAERLVIARKDGSDIFWCNYDDLARTHPQLREWRSLVNESSSTNSAASTSGHIMDNIKTGISLADIEPEEVKWVWERRLAAGKITLLDGEPGTGKSMIALDIAARVSSGRPMPDGTTSTRGSVILIAPEDSLYDTIQPRLARANADLSRVFSLCTVPEMHPITGEIYQRSFMLNTDLALLTSTIERTEAKLVIIDPVMAVLGAHKEQEIRACLAPLQTVLERYHVSCLLIRHGSETTPHEIARNYSAMALLSCARIGLHIRRDTIHPSGHALVMTKTNVGLEASELHYTVSCESMNDRRPYIFWEDEHYTHCVSGRIMHS